MKLKEILWELKYGRHWGVPAYTERDSWLDDIEEVDESSIPDDIKKALREKNNSSLM